MLRSSESPLPAKFLPAGFFLAVHGVRECAANGASRRSRDGRRSPTPSVAAGWPTLHHCRSLQSGFSGGTGMGNWIELTAADGVEDRRVPRRPARASRAADWWSSRRSSASTATSATCATASPRTGTSRWRRRSSTAWSAASTWATRPDDIARGREIRGRVQTDHALADIAAARAVAASAGRGRRGRLLLGRLSGVAVGVARSGFRLRDRLLRRRHARRDRREAEGARARALRREGRAHPGRRRARSWPRRIRPCEVHFYPGGPRLQLRPARIVRRGIGEARARAHDRVPPRARGLACVAVISADTRRGVCAFSRRAYTATGAFSAGWLW